MRNHPPKIVVIGAGSASFGLTNLGAIMRTPELKGATLALCDLNAEGLQQIGLLAQRINREWDAGMTLQTSVRREELLPGADFVVISIALDREKCWRMDQELGKKYGIMHYAENGGPGGFFHAARNVALLMPVFRDIERLAPNALVLNFTNPMTRVCTAAARYTKLNVVGICHQLDFGYMMAGRILGKKLGLDINHAYRFRWDHDPEEKRIAALAHERLDILAAGVNHFTWYLSIRDKQTGEELLPEFYESFLAQNEFEPYTRALIETFGCCPVSGDAHCLEYLPYTASMARGTWEHYDIQMYPLDGQDENRDAMWHDIGEMAANRAPTEHLRHTYSERAEQIMAAVWSGNSAYDQAVNLVNTEGYITNLPRDAVVEVPAAMGAQGIRGLAIGELPRFAAQFCSRQVEIVDLAVKAMVEGDRRTALQALAIDPMVDDLRVARMLLDEGLDLFREYLPQFWNGTL